MDTRKLKCDCDHEYQDKLYGKGVRLHNYCVIGDKRGGKDWRCTVCNKMK